MAGVYIKLRSGSQEVIPSLLENRTATTATRTRSEDQRKEKICSSIFKQLMTTFLRFNTAPSRLPFPPIDGGSDMADSRRTPPLPVTRQQAEVASAAATTREREKNLELGAATAIFALAVLLGWLCLPKEAKHPGNARLTASLLLSFATFLTGNALMMLSFNMLGLRERLVSSGQRAAERCLRTACPVMLVLTLFSLLLALLRGGVYPYLGLAFVTVIVPAAAGVHCYLMRRRAEGGGDGDGDAADEEQKKLDAASKITSCVTTSAFGGIVGVLFSASKISAGSAGGAGALDTAAYCAIFFMFATAILGMFVTTVSKKVPEIGNPPCRKLFITGVRLANAFLLCTLACAACAASFAVSRYRVLAAFAPLVVAATASFLLWHCVARRRGRGRGHAGGGGADLLRENHEARIKAMEDIASKVMVAALGGIMSVLGGWLGEKDHAKWGAMDMFMIVLTSVFVSSFGFMVLAAAPGSARECLAPVARVLIWSTVALFTATAVAVYGVEVSGLDNPKP